MGIKTERKLPPRILLNPSIRLGESYIKLADKHCIKEDMQMKKYINIIFIHINNDFRTEVNSLHTWKNKNLTSFKNRQYRILNPSSSYRNIRESAFGCQSLLKNIPNKIFDGIALSVVIWCRYEQYLWFKESRNEISRILE